MEKTVMIIIGVICLFAFLFAATIVSILVYAFNSPELSFAYPPESSFNDTRCQEINITITSLNSTTNKASIYRYSGGEDFPTIKVYYYPYKATSAHSAILLKENTEIILDVGRKLNYANILNANDTIYISPVLDDKTLCDLKSGAIASK